MKPKNLIPVLLRSFLPARHILVLLALVAACGCVSTQQRAGTAAPAEFAGGSASNRLSALIDSVSYSAADKEALRNGLSVAIPIVSDNEMTMAHVSQETVDIQIKKLQTNFLTSLTLISNVAQCLEDQAEEFVNSRTFQRLPLSERDEVVAYLSEAVQQYRARAFETLLQHRSHPLTVPANITPSMTNAQYRDLLSMAIKTCQEVHPVTERYYTLKSGDSLALVARLYKVSSAAILEANPGLDPIRMRVGQVIVVPPPVAPAKTRAATKAPSKG